MHTTYDTLVRANSPIRHSCPSRYNKQAPMVAEQLMIPKMYKDYPTGEFDVDLLLWDGSMSLSLSRWR